MLLFEEGCKKKYRSAMTVVNEATATATVILLRDVYRVNPFGFFSRKVNELTLVGEMYCLGQGSDKDNEETDKEVKACFGEDMERVN